MLAKQHKRNILIFSPIHVVCKKRIGSTRILRKHSKIKRDLAAVDNFISTEAKNQN